MFGLIVALLVVAACGYLIIKKYKAQAVLICGGFIMMATAIVFNYGPLVPANLSTGSAWFDIFKFVDNLASRRTADLGLMIMACAGFAKYMNVIGANKALVNIAIRPLKYVQQPYLVLCGGFIIGQILHPFIPSASGFGLLLMVTIYPIYVSLGIPRATATAVIATNGCLDLGPSSGNSILAAKYAGITPVEYFVIYQMPMAIAISIALTITHYLVQRYYDNKYEGGLAQGVARETVQIETSGKQDEVMPPLYYALLPGIPLILVLLFGYFKVGGIKMDITVALFIGLFASMVIEFLRCFDLKKTFAGIQSFFDGMGTQFATVITLIIAGETFAKGLQSLGAINTMIGAAESAGFGTTGMIFVMSAIIAFSSLIMGSGNAPFFAFSAFAPDVAKRLGIEAVHILLPMQLTASVARAMSPITAVVVAVAGVAGVSPFEVVRRTAIPLIVGLLTVQVMTYIMF